MPVDESVQGVLQRLARAELRHLGGLDLDGGAGARVAAAAGGALADGEDYELLLALRADPAGAQKFLAAWRRAFPRLPLTLIGQFAPRATDPAAHGALDLSAYHGFEHFH